MCVCECVCVCIPVREPHALSAEVEVRSERAGRPPGDPNHTQAMHYRRNQRGGEVEDEDAEKWNIMEEDRRV